MPGNVILRKGEANLSKKCVVNTTQIKSVDKRSIKEKVGTLSKKRMDEVHEGLKIVTGNLFLTGATWLKHNRADNKGQS